MSAPAEKTPVQGNSRRHRPGEGPAKTLKHIKRSKQWKQTLLEINGKAEGLRREKIQSRNRNFRIEK